MSSQPIGALELEVWRFVADRKCVTVAEAAKEFAATRGLARTTILTVMERLRRKKYLSRRRAGAAWCYFTRKPKADLLRSMVGRFMEAALGGSLDPFLAFLIRDARLTDDQLQELKNFIAESERKRGKKGDGQ